MKQIVKNNRYSIICLVIVAVFVALTFCLATAFNPPRAIAETTAIEVGSGVSADGNMGSVTVYTTSNGSITCKKVETAENLVYALRTSGGSENFLLMNDFVITDTYWVNGNSENEISSNFYGYVLDKNGKIVENETRTLTLATQRAEKSDGTLEYHSTKFGGLFGKFSGKLSNLTYRFSGRIEIMGTEIVDANPTIVCGGLAGVFTKATIDNCNISVTGSIFVYGQKEGVTTYAGGLFGQYLSGHILNSRLSIGGTVSVANKLMQSSDDEKIKAIDNKMFAGGIAGHVEQIGTDLNNVPNIKNSDVLVTASISTDDLTASGFGDEIGSIIGGIIGGWGDKCNDDAYIFPAAGLFAQVSKIEIEDSTLNVSGSISVTGGYLASKAGAIAGGLFGITDNGTIKLQRNTIVLDGRLKTKNESKEKFTGTKYHGIVYQGGIIGKIVNGINGSMANCVIEKSGNFYTETECGANADAMEQNYGYFTGNDSASFARFNGGNIWIKGDIQGLVFNNGDSNCGVVHDIKSYGGGYLTHTISSNGQIIFRENRQFAAFYGWFTGDSALANNSKYTDRSEIIENTVHDYVTDADYVQSTYRPSINKANSVSMIAVFLTEQIYTAGNMVEFAEEMNGGLNFPWLKVTLENDIQFVSGMPVITKFDGAFDGKGHTITFSAGSSIIGNGNVAMFSELATGSSFKNTKIVFAGTVYGGTQNADTLDDSTVSAVLVAINNGNVADVSLELTQAGSISSFGKTNVVGGLIGINKANNGGIALEQIDVTVDGKISAVGNENSIGCLVGSSASDGSYDMINVFAKGEVVSSMVASDSASVAKANLGGFAGKLEKRLSTKNTVVNVRDYSNYNNNVLMASCNHNKVLCENLKVELNYLFNNVAKNDVSQAKSDISYIREEFFGSDGLNVAKRSQNDYNTVKTLLTKLANGYDSGATTSEQTAIVSEIISLVNNFDCSAQCSNCSKNTNIYALVGSTGNYAVGYNNTWVMGSYTQIPGTTADGTSENPLAYHQGETNYTDALSHGLNLLYVRDGSATCLMDISSKDAQNIKFTVSVDTSKVFTGWYTEFDHSVMVNKDYIASHVDESGATVQVLCPGEQTGMAVYSSVINSLIVDADVMNKLAVTTNAGQSYKGVRFVLGANIDISMHTVIGSSKETSFDGTLDGKGYTVTISGFSAGQNYFGLFGYLGENAKIVQLKVVYDNPTINVNSETGVFGGIAAVNEGVIGQDSTSNKVTAIIYSAISGVRVAGGLVGINEGVVKNAEVYYKETDVYKKGSLRAQGFGSDKESSSAIVGGAVGYNKESAISMVKNVIVFTECSYDRNVRNFSANSGNGGSAYVGGLVGYNSSKLYSSVVKVAYETYNSTIVDNGENSALLIGYNEFDTTDSLWVLYSFDPTVSDFAFVTPSMDDDGNFNFALINGAGSNSGNRLVKYGYGDVKVSIYSNNESQPFGGSIVFEAVEMIPDGKTQTVPFYNYTTSLTSGGIVSSSDGGSGQNFSPTVKTNTKSSLKGVNYYAVFIKTEITSEADFYEFIDSINSEFKAYANYIINLSAQSEINLFTSDEKYRTIDLSKVFVGNFNGNGYTIRVRSATNTEGNFFEGFAIFGIVSEYSCISNLTYYVESGSEFKTATEYLGAKSIGSFVNVNNGVIENVTFVFSGTVIGDQYVDYAGGFIGSNYGSIAGISATYRYENSRGSEYNGTVIGNVSGGIVGYNAGTVGSDRLDSVKVVLSAGSLSSSVIGVQSAGGIIGLNEGLAKNLNAKVSGRISCPDVSGGTFSMKGNDYPFKNTKIGGVVGENKRTVESAVCYVYAQASIYTYGQGSIGGIAGENSGRIGNSSDTDSVKVYFYANVKSSANSIGGIVGSNIVGASVMNGFVNVYGSISGAKYVGGAVGFNSNSSITDISVFIDTPVVLSATDSLGGLVGINEGEISRCDVTVSGVLGDKNTRFVGGVIGKNSSTSVSDSFVIIRNELKGSTDASIGLVSGRSVSLNGIENVNVWAVASNSNVLSASGEGSVGFNTLKIVGKAYVNAEFIEDNRIRFSASYIADSPTTWYSDISVLESFNASSNVYTAEKDIKNVNYHVCYYDLIINNSDEFIKIYQYVNDNDLFNGVMFRINSNEDLVIRNTVNPIGTEEHPFAGIFDGDYCKIILEKGGISGSDYCGIFGYLSSSAIIRNLVIEVKEDFIVGSGMSSYAGVLAGHLDGEINNVTVNAISAPYSLKSSAKIGALAGYMTATANLVDVWTVIYNGAVDALGEREGATDDEKDDVVNVMSVIGVGKLSVTGTTYGTSDITFTVLADDDIDVFGFYDNWYADISTRTTIKQMANASLYGQVDERAQDGVIVYSAKGGLREKAGLGKINFTLSFIDLVIRSAEDFYRFAQNINKFGDNGAMFTLDLGKDAGDNYIEELVIDVEKLMPIGTKEHPFTGIFDGMIDTSVNSGNACHTIRLVGNLDSGYNEYTGLFGYVGKGAVIKNLIVRADNATENPDYSGQTFGDKKSIYTGFLVSFLQGSVQNVTVVLGDETELYNINDDSVGGLVGVFDDNADFTNVWLVLPENSSIRVAGGYKQADGDIMICSDANIEHVKSKFNVPSIVYVCGEGLFNVSFERVDPSLPISDENSKFVFSLTPVADGEPVYGFISKDDETVGSRTDRLEGRFTQSPNGEKYLAVFLNPVIKTYEDLVKLANVTNAGRSYKGIEFIQANDITIPSGVNYTTIGGQVKVGDSTIGTEYKLVEFVGIYNGDGHKIIIPSDVVIDQAYAGIFGILGKGARISNLHLEVSGSIGGNETKYAGALAGVDNGAILKNIIVELKKSSKITASLSTSRVAVNETVELDAYGNVLNWSDVKCAENVWVLAYNNKFNNESNLSEQSFYDAAEANGKFKSAGAYNGGINVITVVGAGELKLTFVKNGNSITGVNIAKDSDNRVKEWYRYLGGNKESFNDISLIDVDTTLDKSYNSLILYASFLNSEISSDDDLIALARDTNNGYDFYGLTFSLSNDVVIDGENYIGIGADIPFNATFDGNGNKITLKNGAIIKGKYAGIFGNIGEYGKLKNVILQIDGQIGWSKYTAEEVKGGLDNTAYAGAVAYVQGTIENVIIIGTSAIIDCQASSDGNVYGSISFGFDSRNIWTNVWVIVSANNLNNTIGYVANNTESSINLMKVVGMGSLNVGFEIIGEKYVVRMENEYSDDKPYSIKGWYSNYSKDNQLSKALGVTENDTDVRAGNEGVYYPKTGLINRRYEVVIINTVITKVEQLLSIASDVNKGGYTYENTSFSLGANLVITDEDYASIGTQNTHFKGGFSGYYNGRYYSVTMAMFKTNLDGSKTPSSVPLFGYNEGVIENLSIVLATDIRMPNSEIGIVASYNYGTISGVIVSFDENKSVLVKGNKVGGLVGVNYYDAVVENSLVIVNERTTLQGAVVGGLIAENNGTLTGSTGGDNSDFSNWSRYRKSQLCGLTEYASVSLLGTIDVVNTDSRTVAYGGGAVGISQDLAYVSGLTVRLYDTGVIQAKSASYALGGVVGRSNATLANSVCITKGKIKGEGNGDIGYFVGSIQGTANNSWLVVDVPTDAKAIGNGYEAVNVLQVSGNGIIDAYIDVENNIIFINITKEKPVGEATIAEIDGWYESNGITVSDSIGNVDENTFKPLTNITGRTINVVFINLTISSVEDLNVMAKTVNNGLFAKSLVFTLTTDLEINEKNSLTDCIGIFTEDGAYGFKHVFDGQGHTITFTLSDASGSTSGMNNQKYMGLFGYTSNSAVIKDLEIVYKNGLFGTPETIDFGGISGYNSGRIVNCSVTIEGSARIVAQKVGGIAGENSRLGNIENCSVTVSGSLNAQAVSMSDNISPNVYVGGVTGSNAGSIVNVKVKNSGTLTASQESTATGATYAGGVTGSNSYYIANVEVINQDCTISASSRISAYAGGLSGSNMGTIDSSYVYLSKSLITSTKVIESVAGGLVGANGTIISNVLVDISDDTSVYDSAIGMDKVGTSDVTNVWVYNGNSSFNSKINSVNSMTYQMLNSKENVTYNSVDEIVYQGKIVFTAVLDTDAGVTMFAETETDYASVLLFDCGYLTYSSDSLIFTSEPDVSGVHVKATQRREFNHQTELKAFATALNYGVQKINGEYSLGSDIVITDNFTAIGTEQYPFGAKFNGNYHNLTFDGNGVKYGDGKVDDMQSLFGVVDGNGVIEKLAVAYQYSLSGINSAGIAVKNDGTIRNSVVYTEQDVNLLNLVAKGSSRNENVWIISRVGSDGSTLSGSNMSNNKYNSIVIKGKGKLIIDSDNNFSDLIFTPVNMTDNTIFVGFSGEKNNEIVILGKESFKTIGGDYSGNTFTAEFISYVIEDRFDMMALISVLKLNYGEFSVGEKYFLAGDITVSVEEILPLNKFLGTLDGNNHVITIVGSVKNDADYGFVFGKNEGSEKALFKNITFDVTDWYDDAEVPMYLLDREYKGTFSNVSVLFARDDMRLSATYDDVSWTADNVYAVSSNLPVKSKYSSFTTAGVGLVIFDGEITPTFHTDENGKYYVTAYENQLSEIFVGWYVGKYDEIAKDYFHNFSGTTSMVLELSDANGIYTCRIIDNTVSDYDALTELANAVANGFEMEDKIITLDDGISKIQEGFIIGTDLYSFKGTLDGNGNTIIAQTPLFKHLGGNLRNLFVKVNKSNKMATTISENSHLQNFVMITEMADSAYSDNTKATFDRCWIISPSTVQTGVNVVTADFDDIRLDPELLGDELSIVAMTMSDDMLIVWYNSDGSVYLNDKYSYVLTTDDTVNYNVVATNEIDSVDLLKVLSYASAEGYYSEVKLISDLTIDSSFNSIDKLSSVFYGNGHSITVADDVTDFTLFTNLNQAVYDLKLIGKGNQCVSIGDASSGSAGLVNCVIELYDNATATLKGNVNNSWIVKQVVDDKYETFVGLYADEKANVLGYRYGKINSVINSLEKSVTFSFDDDTSLEMLGFVDNFGNSTSRTYVSVYDEESADVCGLSVLAYNVSRIIRDRYDWNSLVNAMEYTGNDLSGLEFVLDTDLRWSEIVDGEIEYLRKLDGLNGTLNGNFNSIIIDVRDQNGNAVVSDASYDDIIATLSGGKVCDLAVEVFTAVDSVLTCNLDNCWVISYVGDVSTLAGLIKVINKEGRNSVITVDRYNDAFYFDTNDQEEYKLYNWFYGKSYVEGDLEGNKSLILRFGNGRFALNGEVVYDVVAEYQECYTIYVDVIDPITGNAITSIDLEGSNNGTYFPVETMNLEIKATLSNQENEGYVFWGFDYEDPYGAIRYDKTKNLTRLYIDDMSKLKGSIRIIAYYSLLSPAFINITYGEMTAVELNDYLSIVSEQLDMLDELNRELLSLDPNADVFKIFRTIDKDSDTLELDYNEKLGIALPKHAGSYRISFSIKNERYPIASTYFNFTINPKELVFLELQATEKVYDSTSTTTIAQKVLYGFTDEDNQDSKIASLDFSNVELVFVDSNGQIVSNAGVGYYVMISNGSRLESNSDYLFFHEDYCLPKGEILYRYGLENGQLVRQEPFTFDIEKANLSIDISVVEIDYLDQFVKNENGEYFDINDIFRKSYKVEGLKDADKGILDNAKLLRVVGDEIIDGKYIYKIKKPGSYAIVPMEDVLDNYNVTTVTSNSILRVNKSAVTPVLDNIEKQYGYAVDNFTYSLRRKSGDVFYMNRDEFARFKDAFSIDTEYETFIGEYLSLDLKLEYVYQGDSAVSVKAVPCDNLYGIKYRFLQNKSFVFDADKNSEFVYNSSNEKEYLLTADNVLKIVARKITVEYTGKSGKVFAQPDDDFASSARTIGAKTVVGDSLRVSRTGMGDKQYELVGKYKLSFSVIDKDGNDVSAYYDISYQNGEGYYYEITVRKVSVSHLGNSYYYGDVSAMSDMKYSTNLSSAVISSIVSVFGSANDKTLEDLGIVLKVGYFDGDIQNVGTYNCQYKFSAPDNITKCIEFVADSKNCTYTIIPAKLNVVTADETRVYDTTDDIKFARFGNHFTVSGFVGKDADYIEVVVDGYVGDVKAQAGTYLYRPQGCSLAVKSGNRGKEYLLDNYVIDKITNGKYTITPLSIRLEMSIGYYAEDGSFVSTDDTLYYGDLGAVIHFTLIDDLPDYLQELYDSELDENATDKQIGEWIIKRLNITYKSLSSFDPDDDEGGTIEVGKTTNNLYLRSENPNIKISSEAFVIVTKVYFVIKDFALTYEYATGTLTASGNIEVVDENNAPVSHYKLNKSFEGLKAGERFAITDCIDIGYQLVDEYRQGEEVLVKFDLRHNVIGIWETPTDDAVYYNSVDQKLENSQSVSAPVETIYTAQDKLIIFAKEKPYLIALIVVGALLIVGLICFLSIVIYRKKRVSKSAWREILYKEMWDEKQERHDDENTAENVENNGENATDVPTDNSSDDSTDE